MGYNKEIYNNTNKKLEIMRNQARRQHSNKLKNFYEKFPRAKEINIILSKTAIQVGRAVLNGSDTKIQLKKLKEKNQSLQKELKEILIKAKLPENYMDIKYHCNKCNDEGYIDGIMCDCMKDLLRNESYNKLNNLSPLSLSSFDTFSLENYSTIPIRQNGPSPQKRMYDIFNYCKKYSNEFSNKSHSLLMQGSTGLGKTHLSLAIANEVINKRYGVIYGSTPNIVAKLEKERFGYNRDKFYDNSENYLMECDLLILDDLGTEFSTNYSSSIIYNILNSRIMLSKPTIISTNLSMKELEKSYSERLVSRIMGHHVRLEFLGSDIRQYKNII